MNIAFDNVTGFNLKWPSRHGSRPKLSPQGEWIVFNKEKNKLPTATLRTFVLYYRYNGDPSGVDIDLENDNLDLGAWGDGQPNFRFYNNYTTGGEAGGQLGSIWGFPLFNVGNTATNWPRFNSCITDSTINPITSGEDISGNERMLVNLNNRNILILDFSGYDDSNTRNAFKDISNNLQPYVNGGFYLTLRIKSSSESLVFGKHSDQNARVGSHFYAFERLWLNGAWNVQKKKFCTLVEYKFECDIIGPKPMLDLTLDYFSYYDNAGYLFGKDSTWNNSKFLVMPTATTVATANAISVSNKYTTDISINIITGTKYDNSKDTRMDTKYIYDHFTFDHYGYTDWREVVITKDHYWSFSTTHSGYSITKLVGGSSKELVRKNIVSGGGGYYGSNYGTEWNNTNKSNIIGWRWDIDLSANSNLNKWPGDNNNKNYDLNNILWCSLRSPKKVKMRRITPLNSEVSRFITNFIDISGTYSVGGGYGRYTNTLDMPRSSQLPYYDSSGNTCVAINDFVINNNNAQYLDANNSKIPGPAVGTTVSEFNRVRTLNEIEHYRIYYKLLIPPESGTCSITYTFGKNTNPTSNVTFFRYNDMSGNPIPQGKYNYNAIRDTESIQLNWTNQNTEINSMVLTDVASGFSKYTANISFQDPSLNKTRDTTTEDYDISCNVFQIIFDSLNESGSIDERYGNPYSIKIFDSNSQKEQIYDVKYVPENYIPYRYIDIDKLSISSATSCEEDYYWKKIYTQPLLILNEQFNYNTIKVYPRKAGNYILNQQPPIFQPDTNTGAAASNTVLPRAVIISPEAERIVDTINFNINTINDASFSVISEYNLDDNINQLLSPEEIAIFTKNNTMNTLSLLNESISIQVSGLNGLANIIFYIPSSLREKNNFIPDYWRLQDKVNTIRKNDQSGIISYDTNYGHFAKWSNQIHTTALFDILNVILKGDESNNITTQREVSALLINSNKNSIEWSAVDVDGGLITGNIIFNVQGATGLPPGATLTERPIVVQLIAISTGPFGSTTVNYIGDTGGSTNSGINSANYISNLILPNTMRQGNNNGNNFPNTNAKSYNGLYDITMSGWDEVPVLPNPRQNPYFNNISISPSPLKVLLVDISNAVQTNGADYRDMVSTDNKSVIIKWTGFYFSNDISWNFFPVGQDGDIEWIISRYNIATGISKIMYTGTVDFNLSTKEYSWNDNTINVYDKYTWNVKGNYKWYGITKIIPGAKIPSVSVPGFTTPECFICKFNRFQYGRYNTTSTNLKLFAPLKINLPEGQVNQFGKKVCGGGCTDPKNPGLTLFTGSTGISSSNNIYANTTNQLSKKQTYVLLAKSRFRPSR